MSNIQKSQPSDEWVNVQSDLPSNKPNDEFEIKELNSVVNVQPDLPQDKPNDESIQVVDNTDKSTVEKMLEFDDIDIYTQLKMLSPTEFAALCNNTWLFKLAFKLSKYDVIMHVLLKCKSDNIVLPNYKEILDLAVEYYRPNLVSMVISNVATVDIKCLLNAIENIMSEDIVGQMVFKCVNPNKLIIATQLLKYDYFNEFEKLVKEEYVQHSSALHKSFVEKNLINSIKKFCEIKHSRNSDEEVKRIFDIVIMMMVNNRNEPCTKFIKANYDETTIQYQNKHSRTIFGIAIMFNNYSVTKYLFENFFESLPIKDSLNDLFEQVVSKEDTGIIGLFLLYTTPSVLCKKKFSNNKLVNDINEIIGTKELKYENEDNKKINIESVRKMIDVFSGDVQPIEEESLDTTLQKNLDAHRVKLVKDKNGDTFIARIKIEDSESFTFKFLNFNSRYNETINKHSNKIKELTLENLKQVVESAKQWDGVKILYNDKVKYIKSVDVKTGTITFYKKSIDVKTNTKVNWNSPDLKYWD